MKILRMAETLLLLLIVVIVICSSVLLFPSLISSAASVVDDLNKLQPPPDFNTTITNNCHTNPSLRYCNTTPFDLHEIFKSTIVASHLCNISNNPNCVESFPKIDLHSQPKIAPLYLSFSFFWKYCPLTIISINFSNNSLKGSFPTDIFHCFQIQELDLRYNNLSGDLPVQTLSLLENLTFLNLSYNRFSESEISDKHFFEHFNSSSFINSGLLPDHKGYKIKAVILLVGFPVFVIAMVVFLGWLCFKSPDILPGFLHRRHNFTPTILNAATDGFSRRNLVGETGNVSMYRGVLRDGTDVRIDVYLDNYTSREKRRRFVKQAKVLVKLSHKNIVPVLGFCDSRRVQAIVAECTDGENIANWLSTSTPSWKKRVKVIRGIASGICYLHEEWPEVGYNLRTRNVVLSENGEPLITRLRLDDHHRNRAKEIYRFGVFLLEVVTNRRAAEEFEEGENGFVVWVRSHCPEDMEIVIDKRMKKTEDIVFQAVEVLKFGLLCTDVSSSGEQDCSWDEIWNLVSEASCMISSSDDGDRHNKHMHQRTI